MKKVRWLSATVGPALVAAMFALPAPGGPGGTVRGFPSYSPSGGSRARGGYERGVCASGIHALFSWLLPCRLRMCGLGV